MKPIPLFVIIACSASAGGLDVRHISDQARGLDATRITIRKDDNRGFALIDVPSRFQADTIQRHWRSSDLFMINGGYFNSDFSPTGYCRIGGRVLGTNRLERLSGFVAIDETGILHLLDRHANLSPYPTVLQSGPFVIDPGGTMGIRSDDGQRARRTLIGLTKDNEVVILVTQPITLYSLALAVRTLMPEIERLLNLDGGPSTALKTADIEILNIGPVRNYLVKRPHVDQKRR